MVLKDAKGKRFDNKTLDENFTLIYIFPKHTKGN